MSATHLPFSHQEYQRRLRLTREAMAQKGIDVLFVEDPSNMAWLTSYDGWSFYVHQGVLVFMMKIRSGGDDARIAVRCHPHGMDDG
ncbi:MAG: aminopeptidase P family N-terminal domain-containing protein [Thiolinea sp.]